MQKSNGKGRDLEQFIYNELKDQIINLTLEPGTLLNENEICAQFDASRTPVRVVLQRLAAEGWIDIIPYKGARVTLLDRDLIRQSIFLRKSVEGEVLKAYIDTMDSLDLEDFNHQLRVQQILLSHDFEPEEFYELDADMHCLWYKKTRNLYTWNLLQNLEVNYTRFRLLDLVEKKQFQEIYDEHVKLFEAVKNKDKEQTKLIIDYHLDGGIRRLSTNLEVYKNYFL